MLAWLRRQFGWTRRVRVRVADVGPEARAIRRLIERWLPDGPDIRPQLQGGWVEIVVLHHVRLFGEHGPVVAALTERAGNLTRIALGRCHPGTGLTWPPYSPAELLSALDLHLDALARGYAPPERWFPGAEALVAGSPPLGQPPAALAAATPPTPGHGNAATHTAPAAAPDPPRPAPVPLPPDSSLAARPPVGPVPEEPVADVGGAGADPPNPDADSPAAQAEPPVDRPPADGVLWPLDGRTGHA